MESKRDGTAALTAQLTRGRSSIDVRSFAGGMPQEKATLPQLRAGKRWFSTAQLLMVTVPLGLVAALALIFVAQQLRTLPEVQAFIVRYPGTGEFGPPVESGFPWWLRCPALHELLPDALHDPLGAPDPRGPPAALSRRALYAGEGVAAPARTGSRRARSGPRSRIAWRCRSGSVCPVSGTRSVWRAGGTSTLDTLWLANGVVFYVLLFSTDQWMRIVPQSWDVIPERRFHGAPVRVARLSAPQRLAPVQRAAGHRLLHDGIRRSPARAVHGSAPGAGDRSALPDGEGALNRQVARTIHFAVLCYFVVLHRHPRGRWSSRPVSSRT